MATDGQRFCLKWNDFRSSVTGVFEELRRGEELVDVTLCCDGKKLKAHRMMLSACSPYFRDLLKENPCQHPVFFLKDTSYPDLAAVVEFVYNGEVNVTQSQLSSFLRTAEMLQVRGLTGDEDKDSAPSPQQPRAAAPVPPPPRPPPPPSLKRPPPVPPPSATPPKRVAAASMLPEQKVEPVTLSDSPPPPPPVLERAPGSPGRPSGGSGGPATPLDSEAAGDTAAASPAAAPPANVKVEKVDIDLAEDEESLEAALGSVVNYEVGYSDQEQAMGGLFAGADLSQDPEITPVLRPESTSEPSSAPSPDHSPAILGYQH